LSFTAFKDNLELMIKNNVEIQHLQAKWKI